MSAATLWWIGAILAAGVFIANEVWRRGHAREIAEHWLAANNYRVREMHPVYMSIRQRFRATPFRNNNWAVDFHAEVDDMRLGGTGELRLRVWTDLLGIMGREPELYWERMPTMENGGALTPELEWENAQIALLRHVAAGNTTLRPLGRDATARAEFDTMVEHVLALQRRGFLHCATPYAELHGGAQYAEIADVVITPEGRQVLERADAESQPPAAGV